MTSPMRLDIKGSSLKGIAVLLRLTVNFLLIS